MKVFKLTLLVIILSAFNSENSSANRTYPNRVFIEEGKDSEKLLRIVQSEHLKTTYQYNTDSTLRFIKEERNGRAHSESEFIYEDGKVVEKTYQDAYNPKVKVIIEYEGELLVKQTYFQKNEVVAIEEYFYNGNNQLIKQIEKREWNNELNKQLVTIDIFKVPGENELKVKYNGVLKFIVTYDDKASPYSNIKGYSAIYATQFYGITNNILSFKSLSPKGKETSQITDLKFDSSGDYLLETTKSDGDKRLICKEVFTYK